MNRKLWKNLDMLWSTKVNIQSIYCPQWHQICYLICKKCDTRAKELDRNEEQWQITVCCETE